MSVDVASAVMDVDLQVLRHQGLCLQVSPLPLMAARPDHASLSKHHQKHVPVATPARADWVTEFPNWCHG